MLMLTPAAGSRSTPPMNEIAIPAITQKERRSSRKIARVSRTMTTPSMPLPRTSWTRLRKSSALLLSTRHITPGGNCASAVCITSLTASAMSSGDWSPTR